MKKLICLGMMFLFVFSLAACRQGNTLADYKAEETAENPRLWS